MPDEPSKVPRLAPLAKGSKPSALRLKSEESHAERQDRSAKTEEGTPPSEAPELSEVLQAFEALRAQLVSLGEKFEGLTGPVSALLPAKPPEAEVTTKRGKVRAGSLEIYVLSAPGAEAKYLRGRSTVAEFLDVGLPSFNVYLSQRGTKFRVGDWLVERILKDED